MQARPGTRGGGPRAAPGRIREEPGAVAVEIAGVVGEGELVNGSGLLARPVARSGDEDDGIISAAVGG